MLRKLVIALVAVTLLMLARISTAFAAQGQITEVNPSGLTNANQVTSGHVGQVISQTGASGVFSDETFTECFAANSC